MAFSRIGYGQVEPNHLTAPRNGGVYGQLPAAATITQLENGMFVKYDYAAGQCAFSGAGPWYMVFNEEKLYDERHQMHKDYVMKASDFYDGKMYPRVFAMHAGDIFTTNMVKAGDSITYAVGQYLKVGSDGVLELDANANKAQDPSAPVDGFRIVKITTMPDGQAAVKIQVVA